MADKRGRKAVFMKEAIWPKLEVLAEDKGMHKGDYVAMLIAKEWDKRKFKR